jgi:hypothetical protein
MLFLKTGHWNRYFVSPYILVTGGLLGGLLVSFCFLSLRFIIAEKALKRLELTLRRVLMFTNESVMKLLLANIRKHCGGKLYFNL